MKSLTRREFFSLYSRDKVKDIFGAWHSFNEEVNKFSRDETAKKKDAKMLFEKVKRLNKTNRKEG